VISLPTVCQSVGHRLLRRPGQSEYHCRLSQSRTTNSDTKSAANAELTPERAAPSPGGRSRRPLLLGRSVLRLRLAADFVHRQVTVIAATATPGAYVVGFAALMLTVGWQPHPPHKADTTSANLSVEKICQAAPALWLW
jgi:hypothetical protein